MGKASRDHTTYPATTLYVLAVSSDPLIDKIAQVFGEQTADYAITDEAAVQPYTPSLSVISPAGALIGQVNLRLD
jgi:hypothetical protein